MIKHVFQTHTLNFFWGSWHIHRFALQVDFCYTIFVLFFDGFCCTNMFFFIADIHTVFIKFFFNILKPNSIRWRCMINTMYHVFTITTIKKTKYSLSGFLLKHFIYSYHSRCIVFLECHSTQPVAVHFIWLIQSHYAGKNNQSTCCFVYLRPKP